MPDIDPNCAAGVDCEGCPCQAYCPQRDPLPRRLRNLKAEAVSLAGPGVLVRVRENKRSYGSPHWSAWDVHVKPPGATRGRCIATLVHRHNTVFETPVCTGPGKTCRGVVQCTCGSVIEDHATSESQHYPTCPLVNP